MKVAILGIGGVGRSLAWELIDDARVSSLLFVDKSPERARASREMHRRKDIESRVLNVANRAALGRVLRDCDVVVNATVPDHNLAVMASALQAGVDYLDLAATGPRTPGGPPGILEQLDRHNAFRDAGLTGLLSMGLDPGMSNVMAKEAAEHFDAIDAIRIRSGGTVKLPRGLTTAKFVPLYSREAFFSDIMIRPSIWSDGSLVEQDLLSGEETFAFPPPVGPQRTYLISHEEVKTLPRFLGKPVRNVDFKYAIDPDLAQALVSLENLGLLAKEQQIPLDRRRIAFRHAFQMAFPDPLSVADRLEGTKCVTVEVEGVLRGVHRIHRSHIALRHQEAARRRKTTAVYYLTSVAAAIGVAMIAEGALPGPGVYPAEVLDPARVFAEWAARDLPIERSESVVPN